MSNEVITAIIGGLCVAVPSVISSILLSNKSHALMDYRLQELTKQVEKHNNVIERMALVEQSVKSLWKRLDELKMEVRE